MADYAVTGKKGTGKTLFAVGVARDGLKAGKRVAANVDIHLDKLFSPRNRFTYTRLPDRPTVADLEALGRGQEGVIEDDNGILLLDESGISLNARSFADKGRQELLDYIAQIRKHGWDVYYLLQGLPQLDKQVRETQIEYHVPVKRTDKWPIPIVTPLAKMVGLTIRFPKLHVGIVKYGIERDALVCERRWYRGRDLYEAYNTQQLFLPRDHPEACGLHTKLSAWHVRGRYLGWWDMNKPILAAGLMMGAVIGGVLGGVGGYQVGRPKADTRAVPFAVDSSMKVVGVIRNGGAVRQVQLADNRILAADEFKKLNDGEYVRLGEKWAKIAN